MADGDMLRDRGRLLRRQATRLEREACGVARRPHAV